MSIINLSESCGEKQAEPNYLLIKVTKLQYNHSFSEIT